MLLIGIRLNSANIHVYNKIIVIYTIELFLTADRRLEKGEYCGVCEVVIQYLDSLLENNRTVANIEKYLEIVCNFLPKDYRKQVRKTLLHTENLLIDS